MLGDRVHDFDELHRRDREHGFMGRISFRHRLVRHVVVCPALECGAAVMGVHNSLPQLRDANQSPTNQHYYPRG